MARSSRANPVGAPRACSARRSIAVLLGGGTPLFTSPDAAIDLERTHAVVTPAATHPGFRVVQ